MRRLKTPLGWLLAVFMTGAGAMHFARPEFYRALIPPFLPAPLFLVYASGVCEIGFGLGLLVRRWRKWAAWGTVATLIAVFPANIHHAVSGGLSHPDLPAFMANATLAWARLPLQLVFLAWAWWFTRPDEPAADEAS